jgi:hypothetical protein
MLHFEDPRSQSETDPESPIVFIKKEYPPDELPLSTKIMLVLIVACILVILALIIITGGAIMGA